MINGSFTVEASFVISLILIILGSFLFFGFRLHDEIVSQVVASKYVDEITRYMQTPINTTGELDTQELTKTEMAFSASKLTEQDMAEWSTRFADEVARLLFAEKVSDVSISYEDYEVILSYMQNDRISSSAAVGISAKKFVRLYRGIVWRPDEDYLCQ